MAGNRVRIDNLLVERELAPSRARAQAMILAGTIVANGARVDKAGERVPADAEITITGDHNPYVSRGGLKLAAALEAFAYDPRAKVVIDVGASTGGFTDCLLKAGAARVYAVDVGYGQLAWPLRQDDRVIVLERFNARHLTAQQIPEPCDLVVIDASFISIAKLLPALHPLMTPDGDCLAMVKPQFEAERREVGKGGVIRDSALRQTVIQRAVDRMLAVGFREVQRADSPVHGPKGNIECFVWLRRTP